MDDPLDQPAHRDSGRRSKLRSRARRPGSRTARSMSRKRPPAFAPPVSHSRSNCSEVKAGSTPRNSNSSSHRRARGRSSAPRARRRGRARRRTPRGTARAGRRSGCGPRRRCPRSAERLGQRPLLIPAADVVQVVARACGRSGRGPCRRGRRRGSARACARRRPRSAAGSCSAASVSPRTVAAASKWRAVPVGAQRPVQLLDEEVELLRARHRDLGMEVEVVVQARRPALQPADR